MRAFISNCTLAFPGAASNGFDVHIARHFITINCLLVIVPGSSLGFSLVKAIALQDYNSFSRAIIIIRNNSHAGGVCIISRIYLIKYIQ